MIDARTTPSRAPSGAAPVDDAGLQAWCVAARQWLQTQAWPPSRVVVLAPYAQMMDPVRRAWAHGLAAGFPPRIETTRNWAASLAPFLPGNTDLSGDTARDSLIAAGWIDRIAGSALDPALRTTLVSRLLEAARQLAPLAAARAPHERAAWADGLRHALTPPSAALQWEGLVASLAITWVGLSAYATDVLWSDRAAPGGDADALLVLPGFQDDPLVSALLARWGARGLRLALPAITTAPAAVQGHACTDAEDEAQRAAACVIRELDADRQPVALVAQDRALIRRVAALLHGAGVPVRDETGWRLSTTHVAARLMSLLRAAHHHAHTDDVLDWLQQGPHADAAALLERHARTLHLARWAAVLKHPVTTALVPQAAASLLAGLQAPRPLGQWLRDLAAALQRDGWWKTWASDPAGERIVHMLRLREGAADELDGLIDGAADPAPARATGRRWSLAALGAWVREVLESASFQPTVAGDAPVVVLPMAQLLGRPFAAVVAPGCDEVNLPSSPDAPGQWTPQQRALLGLPTRQAVADAAQAAWQHLLAQPRLHLLWRTQHQGEAVAAAPWVQALQVHGRLVMATDPRTARSLAHTPPEDPRPVAPDLLPQTLSASAYQDLRDCPYRFFALRQLRLQQTEEIEAEPGKRELGNWLHAVLKAFHEARAAGPADAEHDRARLDALAQAEALARGLAPEAGEGAAGFLPFMAAWPALRDGYLAWLASYEASGPRFDHAERSLSRRVGPWRLVGQLDRIDHQSSPHGAIALVIDYKTESRAATLERVKNPTEDTQIAFYAALLGDDTVRGAYLSITDSREASGENTPTRWIEQTHIEWAREQLIEGLKHDLERVAEGHPLPALGEGQVCEFCAARGLCRKDFRE